MVVVTVVRQGARVVACRVELGPSLNSEALDPRDVGEETGRLLDVDAELALVACHCEETWTFAQLAKLGQLPDAGWRAPVGSTQVLWVFKE